VWGDFGKKNGGETSRKANVSKAGLRKALKPPSLLKGRCKDALLPRGTKNDPKGREGGASTRGDLGYVEGYQTKVVVIRIT